MTATETETRLAVNLDLLPACHWCSGTATWIAVYDPCHHQHIICDRCKRGLEQRQMIADEAMPPRPLGTHKCCGGRVYRAEILPL